jgi:ADP-ribosyl-[dinitrogen reductase] hydrolase
MFTTSRLFASAATAPTSVSSCTATPLDRKKAALLGLYIADAVASPVHWYYDTRALKRDYGTISGYVKPKEKLEGSILNLSNTGGGGRGSDQGSIIGDVINHGKKQYWLRGGNYHYHFGLDAGENTLEGQLTRLLVRTMAAKGDAFTFDDFRDAYITFMRTPGSHNDTYASTAHRMFFANLVKGVAPKDCADNDGHNTDAIDALTLTIPVILKYSDTIPKTELYAKVKACIAVTRRTRALDRHAQALTDIMLEVLAGKDLRRTIETVAQEYFDGSVHNMVASSRDDPVVACYIDSSFPALLHFAYKYSDSPERAVLANANAGGENVARGSILGAIMGAAHGTEGWPSWTKDGLKAKVEINSEIDNLFKMPSAL